MTTKIAEKVPFTPGRRTYQGGCQCGAVRWEAELDLAAGTSMCNCTMCSKTGWWGAGLKPEEFRLLTGEDQLLTIWSKPQGNHLLCRKCGVRSFGHGDIPEIGGEYVGLNVRCIEGVNLNGVSVAYIDGLHDTWALIRAAPYEDPFAAHA